MPHSPFRFVSLTRVRVSQLDENEKTSFDHLLHALRCGAPPHGGIALGECRSMVVGMS